MKVYYVGVEAKLNALNVNDQNHDPTGLTPGKRPRFLLHRRQSGLQDAVININDPIPLPRFEHQPPAHSNSPHLIYYIIQLNKGISL